MARSASQGMEVKIPQRLASNQTSPTSSPADLSNWGKIFYNLFMPSMSTAKHTGMHTGKYIAKDLGREDGRK